MPEHRGKDLSGRYAAEPDVVLIRIVTKRHLYLLAELIELPVIRSISSPSSSFG